MATSTATPRLARALYDVYCALPKKERAAFDRLMQGTPNPAASMQELTGAALTRAAMEEVRRGEGTRYATFADFLDDL